MRNWLEKNLVWLLVALFAMQTAINFVLFNMVATQRAEIAGLLRTLRWLLDVLGFSGLRSM